MVHLCLHQTTSDAASQEAGSRPSGTKFGKAALGLQCFVGVMRGADFTFGSETKQKTSRCGKDRLLLPSSGKSCVSPCCECIAPVVLGTIADRSLWEISALCLGTHGALGVEGKKVFF